ncbi:MAG: hypothetical protein J1F61_01720 [Clostridiales bacterium]|nr:hypothetical protein [Clostridiales bacterium]
MLSKNENEVMSAVYSLCDGTEGCLVSPLEIKSVMAQRRRLNDEELDDILNALRVDGYFDLIYSERKGEKMYVINLRESGFAWKRTAKQKQRDISFKIFLAFVGALSTFIFGLILKGLSF